MLRCCIYLTSCLVVWQGVCMHPLVECVSHSSCPTGMMCSGNGRCLPPSITVLNNLDVGASFRAHTTECHTGTAYSMLGASPWGYLPDLLQSHGMCSYRDWTAYRNTWQTCVPAGEQGREQGGCVRSPARCTSATWS